MSGGLKGISGTPRAGTRQRRNWQKFANEFALLLGDGLEITGDGHIAIDLATNPGLEFTGGDLQVKLKAGGHLDKDTDGVFVDEASLDDVFVPYTGATANVDLGAFNLTATTITGTTFTDGTLSINSGSITSGVAGTFSGTLQGGTLTDGTLTINAGSIASAINGTFSGTVQAEQLTSTDDATISDLLTVGRIAATDAASTGTNTLAFGRERGQTGGTGVISATGDGSVALGYAWGRSVIATLTSTGSGSLAAGFADGSDQVDNVTIESSGAGSIALGIAYNAQTALATLKASGGGAIALGVAAGGTLQATALGAVAIGTNVQATAIRAFSIGYNFINSVGASIGMGINAKDFLITADALTWDGTAGITGVTTITGIADGGFTNYDLKVGDTTTPDYGMIQIGNASLGRTSYKTGSIDLDGAVIFRNIGGPVTSQVEFIFVESTGTTTRFALAKAGVGNATYNSRSMLLAGPAPADTGFVTVGYWQTNNSIFDNLACDTAGAGADLGVQNDLEVEGDIFTDSLKESTSGAGITVGSDLLFDDAKFLVFANASGNGIKVNTATPTFGWRDLLGDQFAKNTGGTKPTLTTYNGAIDAWKFSNGDEAFLSFHIPHDYVAGTDIHLHIHWSQTSATATGGTIDFKYFAIYAKGHNQASGSTFTSTPITASFSSININDGGSGLSQYQHHLTEVVISAATATAALFDRDDFEPDGVVELTLEMDTNSLTDSVAVQDPFIHYVDLHYQSTNIGTKEKAPDFYA